MPGERPGSPLVRCFGGGSHTIERALQKLADSGIFKGSLALLFDYGDPEENCASLAALLANLEVWGSKPLTVGRIAAAHGAPQRVASDHLHEISVWPLEVRELVGLAAQACPASDLRSELLDVYLYLCSQLRAQRNLAAAPGHGEAIRKLWTAQEGSNFSPDAIPMRVVVIDDEEVFRARLAERMGGRFAVSHHASLEAYQRAVEKGEAAPAESVDLFLLDILEPESGAQGFSMTGLERALPVLNLARGLRSFPQIYMLSAIPRELAAHLCHRVGADYYLEKSDLRLDPDPGGRIASLLNHLDAVAQILEAGRPPSEEVRRLWKGWPAAASHDRELIRSLFSRWLQVKRIDCIKVLNQGKSGARVYAVSVWSEGYLAPITVRIVKVDSPDKLAQEWTAFHRHIASVMTHSFGRVEPYFVRTRDAAAISLTLAGSAEDFSRDSIIDCKEMIENPRRDVGGLPRRIFGDLLSPLHRMNCSQKLCSALLEFLAEDLAPVQVAITDLGEGPIECEIQKTKWRDGRLASVQFRCVKGENRGFPIYTAAWPGALPTPYWRARPGKRFRCTLQRPEEGSLPPTQVVYPSCAIAQNLKEAEPHLRGIEGQVSAIGLLIEDLRSRIEVKYDPMKLVSRLQAEAGRYVQFGVVHGDLNLRNILGSESTPHLWLIDFANTRPGIPAIDFVTFEVEVRTQVLLPRLACQLIGRLREPNEWYECGRRLLEEFEASTQDEHRVNLDVIPSELWTGSLAAARSTDRDVIRRAWQVILGARSVAFETLYQGTDGRNLYDAMLTFFSLRVLQKYKLELLAETGPLGSLWAAVILENCMERMERLGFLPSAEEG